MNDRKNLEPKNWFDNFVKQYHRGSNNLTESIRKFVWNIYDLA